MDQIILIILLAGLFLVGNIIHLFSKRARFSEVTLLILAGFLLNFLLKETQIIQIINNTNLIFTLSLISIFAVIFNKSKTIKIKHIDTNESYALKFTLVNFLLTSIALTFAINIILNINLILSFMISIILFVANKFYKDGKSSVYQIIDYESKISNMILIILSFFILGLLHNTAINYVSYTLNIILSIGMGIIASIIFLRYYKDNVISSVFLLLTSVIIYLFIDFLGGIGIFGIISFFILFSNYNKYLCKDDEHALKTILKYLNMLVFIMVGFMVGFVFDFNLLFNALIIFMIYFIVRLISVYVIYHHSKFTRNELLLMSIYIPKNMTAGAIILLFLSSFNQNIYPIIEISVLLVIYSEIMAYFGLNFYKETNS